MTFVRLILPAIIPALGFASCTEADPRWASPPPPPPPKLASKPKRVARAGQVATISISDFFVLQQSGQALILDARPGFYFRMGHIPGAISFSKADFAAQFPKREKDLQAASAAGKTIVIYCTDLPCPDARALANRLAQSGYSASVLTGGWASWKESGLPIE